MVKPESGQAFSIHSSLRHSMDTARFFFRRSNISAKTDSRSNRPGSEKRSLIRIVYGKKKARSRRNIGRKERIQRGVFLLNIY
jgi:hypothetical protein